MIRVGIAGIGFMGMIHFHAYQKVSGVRVDAICSRNPRRRAGDWRGIRGNFGPAGAEVDLSRVNTYAALDDLLDDPNLDLIDITLPPAMHAEVAIKAMQANKHVLCEKPIALNMVDARRMMLVSARTDRRLFVGQTLPFVREYAWALNSIRGGKYGKLLGGSFQRVISEPTWLDRYWSAESMGGPMLDLHVHDAHFIRLLFGMPRAVITQGRMRGEFAEYWHTQFRYGPSGPVVQATSGVIAQQGRPFEHGFEIHLERATLAFDFAIVGKEAKYLCPATLFNNRGGLRVAKLGDGDPMFAFIAELKEVATCLRQDRGSSILEAELAVDALLLCQKQMESLRSGRRIKI